MVLGGNGSFMGGTDYNVVVLGQYGAVMVGTWWYWVRMGRYCLVLEGTGSVLDGTIIARAGSKGRRDQDDYS